MLRLVIIIMVMILETQIDLSNHHHEEHPADLIDIVLGEMLKDNGHIEVLLH